MSDPINPAHYKAGAVECIDAIEAAVGGLPGVEAFLTGQCIKYLWRWKAKGGAEDLAKARWYLDRLATKARASEASDAAADLRRVEQRLAEVDDG